MANLDEILLAFSRCEGFPERVRPIAVKRRVLSDHGGSYAPHPSLYIFDNSIQGTMERSAIGRRGSHEPYYFEAVAHGLYRLTEEGRAHLTKLITGQKQQSAQEEKQREAELRSFLQSRTQSPNPPDVVEFNGRRFVRDYPAVNKLKQIYEFSCQVCGEHIATIESARNENCGYAEVHHIRPLGSGHDGPDYPGNMLVLCPNHHAAFDLSTMALNPDSLEVYYLDRYDGLYKMGPLNQLKTGHELDFDCLVYSWELWLRQLGENGLDISEAQPD